MLKDLRDLFGCNLNGEKGNVKIGSLFFTLQYRLGFSVCAAMSVYLMALRFYEFPLDCRYTAPWETDSTNMDYSKRCYVSGLDEHERNGLPHFETINLRDYSSTYAVILVQGFLFLCPLFLWKQLEGKHLKYLLNGLTTTSPKNTEEQEEENHVTAVAVEHYNSDFTKRNFYFSKFYFCDILNLINVIGQFMFNNWLLNGQFYYYGFNYFNQNFVNISPFPKEGHCHYNYYTLHGEKEDYDVTCSILMNKPNSHAYIALWFLLVGLGLSAILSTTFYTTMIFSNYKMRSSLWKIMVPYTLPYENVLFVCKKSNVGDIFVLMQLCKNMPQHIFVEFLRQLVESIEAQIVNNELLRLKREAQV